MENVQFPRYLNRPMQIMIFEMDEFQIFLIGLFLGLVFGGVFWIIMILMPWKYMKLKKEYPRGFLRHSLFGFGFLKFKNYPGGLETMYIE